MPEAETVVVGGDRYSFRLKKYHEKGDGYIIAALEKAGDARPQNIDLMNIHFGASGGMLAYAAFRTQEMDMKDLLDSKFCRIVSVESAPERSARTIRVKFSDAGAGSTRFTGIAEFLPDKGWALSRYEADSTASVQSAVGREAGYIHYKVASTVEYGDDVGGVPVPRRVQRTDDRGRTSIFEFDTVTFGLTPPKEEFTLSFFGLPDVTAPPTDPSRSNMMYWTLGAAVAALLSAVVVAMLGRNDRRNDTGGLEHGVMRPNL